MMLPQGSDGAVVINISPTLFFLTLGTAAGGLLWGAIKFTNFLTAWMTRVEDKVAEIPGLKVDRHNAIQDIMVLKSQQLATDKWIEGQVEEERTLRVAMAEYLNDRRVQERRAGGAV